MSHRLQPDPLAGARWRTSSRSQTSNCVEVAPIDAGVAVALRDSKDRDGPVLVFDRARWSDFVTGAKAGAFDFLGTDYAAAGPHSTLWRSWYEWI